jgi:hypothetical protein
MTAPVTCPNGHAISPDEIATPTFPEGLICPVCGAAVRLPKPAASWLRRNPALAGGMVAVVLALLVGAGVLIGLWIKAAAEAKKAAEDEALTQAANDLLRSLAPQGTDGPMTDLEWEALWKLTRDRDGSLGHRFVEVALVTPENSRKLRDRARFVLPAVVGLNETKRDEVEQVLLHRLADATLKAHHRTDLALVLSAWEGVSRPAADEAARQLIAALKEPRNADARPRLVQGLSTVASRLRVCPTNPHSCNL